MAIIDEITNDGIEFSKERMLKAIPMTTKYIIDTHTSDQCNKYIMDLDYYLVCHGDCDNCDKTNTDVIFCNSCNPCPRDLCDECYYSLLRN